MQTERRVAANPQTKPTDLGCESAERLAAEVDSQRGVQQYHNHHHHHRHRLICLKNAPLYPDDNFVKS